MNENNENKKRECIVKGEYYPEDVELLNNVIQQSFSSYKDENNEKINKSPFAIISPYDYYKTAISVYGSAYSQILKSKYDTIIIIAPLQKIAFPGIALSNYESFNTPFGELDIDLESNKFLNQFNKEFLIFNNEYHSSEYSIEVQLPYIYKIFQNKVKILPIIIGENNTKFTILLSNALSSLFKNIKKKYLIIATTNLTTQLKYEQSIAMDKKFMELLNIKNPDNLSEQLAMRQVQAYGGGGVITLLRLAELLNIENIKTLKYLNTGDNNIDKFKVNSYLSAVLW